LCRMVRKNVQSSAREQMALGVDHKVDGGCMS
jgi:hypothetical protein